MVLLSLNVVCLALGSPFKCEGDLAEYCVVRVVGVGQERQVKDLEKEAADLLLTFFLVSALTEIWHCLLPSPVIISSLRFSVHI